MPATKHKKIALKNVMSVKIRMKFKNLQLKLLKMTQNFATIKNKIIYNIIICVFCIVIFIWAFFNTIYKFKKNLQLMKKNLLLIYI